MIKSQKDMVLNPKDGEMNAGAVITNHESRMKIGHVFADENIMP